MSLVTIIRRPTIVGDLGDNGGQLALITDGNPATYIENESGAEIQMSGGFEWAEMNDPPMPSDGQISKVFAAFSGMTSNELGYFVGGHLYAGGSVAWGDNHNDLAVVTHRIELLRPLDGWVQANFEDLQVALSLTGPGIPLSYTRGMDIALEIEYEDGEEEILGFVGVI